MKKVIVLLFAILFLVSIVSAAEVKVKNYSIPDSISQGEVLKGTVNLSLKDVDANSMVTSNFGGNITLVDLLKQNSLSENFGFSCNYAGCSDDYKVGSIVSSLQLDGSEKYVGFKLTGAVSQVNDLSLKIENNLNGAGSCSEQDLSVSFLKNGNLIQGYGYDLSVDCSSTYFGCFDKNLVSADYDPAIITSNTYCSSVNLTGGYAYRIGANITNATNQKAGTLTMQIFDDDGIKAGECILPNLTSSTQEVDCFVNKTLTKTGPYNICVRSNNYNGGAGPNFKIRVEEKGKKCTEEGRDYEIFAKRVAYSPHYSREVNKSNYNGLTSDIGNYLIDKYSMNCSNYCVVPFIFKGNNQIISFSNPLIYYTRGTGSNAAQIPSESLYLLTKDKALLNMNYTNIQLEYAGFNANKTSVSKFELYINGDKILSKNIDVTESLDFSITPNFVPVGIETRLSIISSKNITSSKWTIANGSAISSTTPYIDYTFLEVGEYQITVESTDSNGIKSVKQFSIIVGEASDSANRLYNEKKDAISNVSKTISTYPSNVASQIKKIIDFDNVQQQVTAIGNELSVSTTDEDYIRVIEKLLAISFPNDIATNNNGELVLLPVTEETDLEYIKKLSNSEKEYSDSSLIPAINSWNLDNYDVKMTSEVYYGLFFDKDIPLITRVKIILTPKTENRDAYLIIDYPIDTSTVVSSTNTQIKSLAGESFSYASISGRSDIEFFLPSEVLVTAIPAYLSPNVDKLNIGEDFMGSDLITSPPFKSVWFSVYIGIIILVFIIVYVMLYEWYKKNYERSLFKSKDDLYNLINFIYNSRMGSVRDSEIKKNLAQSGWKGEQLRYAFKKIDGKRTGMFEIPVLKSRENQVVKQEIEKRQGRPIDARFIKMQNNEVA